MLPGSVVAMARSACPIALFQRLGDDRALHAAAAVCRPRGGAEDAEHAVGDDARRRAGWLAVDADQVAHDVRVNELTHDRGSASRSGPERADSVADPESATAKPSAVTRRNACVRAIAREYLHRQAVIGRCDGTGSAQASSFSNPFST